jgi:formylmethanofuran dehydrogenase subunit A
MEKIIIKNGLVFDPLNQISGEINDILIEDGKIVEKFISQNEIKEIDASGKTVIPGALDIHSHIASQQVNWVRLLGTKNKAILERWNLLTLENIAEAYVSNGYTFLLEANVYPTLSRQTIFNFKNLPVVDKGMLLNVSNLWALEDEFQRAKIQELSFFLSDLLKTCKGFGIKVYNPFEAEMWNFNSVRENIEQGGKLYNFSALDVYRALTEASEVLRLPHSIHAHIEGYEYETGKNNLKTILEKINFTEIKSEGDGNHMRNQVFHLAHANTYNIDGDNSDLINQLNKNTNLDLDFAMIGFDQINPLISSDRRLINNYIQQKNTKLIRSAIESEGDSFVGFRKFDKTDIKHCFFWANAIDLALNVENKWQIQLSFNFPNYSHVYDLPQIATWLLSSDARRTFMEDMNPEFLKQTFLNGNDKVLDFNEFIIITRASPAKSLGLGKIKGSFTPGADGDLNILDIDINQIDPSKDFKLIEKALHNIEYVLKGGQIVKKQDNINLEHSGKIFWTEGKVDKEQREKFMKKKKEFYQKYYSIFYESLENSINEKFLRKI